MQPPLHRSRDGSVLIRRIVADAVPLLLLVLWYYGSLVLPEYILPNPFAVGAKVIGLMGGDLQLATHTVWSLFRVLLSVFLAVVVGATLSLLAKYVWWIRDLIIDRFLPIMNAFPTLGWAILGLYWLGVSDYVVIFVETAILLPFTMINVWQGLQSLDDETIEMATSFTRSPRKIISKIVLPMLVPYLVASVRVSYGVAWKVALIAELFGSSVGLGYLMNNARQQFESPLLFATIVVLIILVYGVDKLVFQFLDRRLSMHKST